MNVIIIFYIYYLNYLDFICIIFFLENRAYL